MATGARRIQRVDVKATIRKGSKGRFDPTSAAQLAYQMGLRIHASAAALDPELEKIKGSFSPISKRTSGYSSLSFSATLSVWMRANWDTTEPHLNG